MTVPSLPMIPLGTARPTCDHCGQPLGDLRIFGHPADEITGDLNQITFQLPPRHKCKVAAPTPIRADTEEIPVPAAGKTKQAGTGLRSVVGL